MTTKKYDVVIIGSGIMGLLGAYRVVQAGERVAVIERNAIGSLSAASSGITRSLRSDYENPAYTALARRAWEGWGELEQAFGQELRRAMGCLNIAITSNPTNYARQATEWLRRDGRPNEVFESAAALQKRFPQFRNCLYGVLEVDAGLGFPRRAMGALLDKLRASQQCDIFEQCSIEHISPGEVCTIKTDQGDFRTAKVVIAAGIGTPKVLEKIDGSAYRLELLPDRPEECVYYMPRNPKQYRAETLPIFACLDEGIYGHPIVKGLTTAVKVGRYRPPQTINAQFVEQDNSIAVFVRQYLPDLAGQSTIQPVTDTDQCVYDMTADGGFVIGPVPGAANVFIAAGFCGTGYKFAPAVSEMICDFALNQPNRYDLQPFNPARFAGILEAR